MSLYAMMRTSASGMAAQANRLGAVSDNIANAGTVGYKRSSVEFATLVLDSGVRSYESGSVEPTTRYAVTDQGSFEYTQSVTDLAIRGDGFFLVRGADGQTLLTRAGSFTPDGQGVLTNAGGLVLLGQAIAGNSLSISANSSATLTPINVEALGLQATPTRQGVLTANLPASQGVVAPGDLPSANAATASFSGKTSLLVYDFLGAPVTLDVYSAKSATGTWEVSVYDQSGAAVPAAFPYASPALATGTLTFDPTTGQLDPSSLSSLVVPVPNGATMTLNLGGFSQLASPYTVNAASADGNSASAVDRLEVTDDGTIFAIYENGSRYPTHRIALATVPSPDNLRPVSGTAFQVTQSSGDILVGQPRSAGFGSIISGALEKSNVDIATELTVLVEAEKHYTANSKVFQTGAELMDVLVNLKR
jgi:flagellar hook protein FlgE